jgi:PAS domain S-box-containing protein
MTFDVTARPERTFGWFLAVALVILWGFLRLVVFSGQFFPLTFMLPLLLCVWTRSRIMLWSMAAVFTVMAAVKSLIMLPGAHEAFSSHDGWIAFLGNVLSIAAGVLLVHLIILLRGRLEDTLAQVRAANAEIQAQNEELEAQSEELSQQNEELAEQSEELAQQAEELEAQNEELQVQTEEVEALNDELGRREGLLEMLLEANRRESSEGAVLQSICHSARGIFGEAADVVMLFESQEHGFSTLAAIDGRVDVELGAVTVRPGSFLGLVLEHGESAAISDFALRPDVTPPQIPDRLASRAMLCAPFAVMGQPAGVLCVGSRQTRDWTDEHFRLAEWLAGQAAHAIQAVRLQGALRESEKRFRIMTDELPLIVWLCDAQGGIEFVNRNYLEFFGVTLDEVLGPGWQPLVHPDDADQYVNSFLAAVDERTSFHAKARVRRHDGEWRWVESYGSPRYAAGGEFRGLVGSSPDVTERESVERALRDSERRARVLNEIDALIHSRLDIEQVLTGVLSKATAVLGSHSARILQQLERQSWWTTHAWNLPESMPLADLDGSEVPAAAKATEGNELLRVTDLLAEEAYREFGRRHGIRSAMVVPLVVHDEALGILAFYRHGAPVAFSDEEADFARRLAASVSLALENARLYEAQRRVALTLQENFIHPLPSIDGLDMAVVAEAATTMELIGGDFHDVFELPDGLVAVLIGDVEGKGVRAAGLTETVRAAVRALAVVSPSARYVLSNVNRMLLAQDSDQFVTALLMVIDRDSGRAWVSSAGHEPPIVITQDGPAPLSISPGPPLGSFEWDYEQVTFGLAPGDTVIAYTDGLTEARRDGAMLAEEGVLATLAQHGPGGPLEVAESLRGAAIAHAGHLQDDLQVLAVRYLGRTSTASHEGRVTLRLMVPHVLSHLIDVRGSVYDFLAVHGVDDETSADVVLCVEEACTNALRHSGSRSPVELQVSVDDGLIEAIVQDDGRGIDLDHIDLERPPEVHASGGRGLYIINTIADRLELCNGEGACVKMTLARRAADARRVETDAFADKRTGGDDPQNAL